MDLHGNIRKLNVQLREVQQVLDEEQQEKDKLRDALSTSERRANALSNESEECRTLLDQCERMKHQLQLELQDVQEQMNETIGSKESLIASKRQLEADVSSLQSELDECLNEIKNSEAKVKRAMLDAVMLADEVRQEQERAAREKLEEKLLNHFPRS